jgi:hypothetical protein
MQVFIYIDNFKKTVKRMGEVWQSMAKDLLVEPGRKMKTVDHADQTGTVELLKPMVNKETGETYKANDMSTREVRRRAGRGAELEQPARRHRARQLTGVLGMTRTRRRSEPS